MTPQETCWKNPIHLLAFGFGSGLAPKAPGTFGTIAAIPFYLLLIQLDFIPYLAVVAVASLIGFWICGRTAKDLGVHDHPAIVWDEFCGFWITMIAAPAGWMWIALGFVLFRIFDIWKPWPIGWLDKKVHGGVGIMIDDIIAGVFAMVVLQGIYRIIVV
ncbi:phosphatidylglycerophosphatase A family protein [Endozoicomonas ascidiicola]|uniref:phosphatidylglycerophosphatase A family protein n=1 Tax=Endozoicomonas ascidiicola TaxID=1698521 RepID=UPI0008307E1F|nr:phosphatidylglycerophosphatase A [Endozoicomonas ascidiicola]